MWKCQSFNQHKGKTKGGKKKKRHSREYKNNNNNNKTTYSEALCRKKKENCCDDGFFVVLFCWRLTLLGLRTTDSKKSSSSDLFESIMCILYICLVLSSNDWKSVTSTSRTNLLPLFYSLFLLFLYACFLFLDFLFHLLSFCFILILFIQGKSAFTTALSLKL